MSYPPRWGPAYWFLIHHVGNSEDPRFPELLACLLTLLPCPACSRHAVAFMDEHPPAGARSMFSYSVLLHNRVNRSLGKLELSDDDARSLYRSRAEKYRSELTLDQALFVVVWYSSRLYFVQDKAVMFRRLCELFLQCVYADMATPETVQFIREYEVTSLLHVHDMVHVLFTRVTGEIVRFENMVPAYIDAGEYPVLHRAHAMRIEDHAKIRNLARRVSKQKSLQPLTIILLVLCVLLVLVQVYLITRR